MRDDLLSIGELARMKGVSVKSLRYYDRLGIFRPALVDPSSGYRYYSLNQLMDLDAITTCIELGIPLKELKAYIEPSGMLDLASLLERGRRQALVRIADARAVLAQVNVQLREINEQSALSMGGETYVRRKRDRIALVQEWEFESFDVCRYARWMTEAYATVKQRGAVPSYLQGFLFVPAEDSRGCRGHGGAAALCYEAAAETARGDRSSDEFRSVRPFVYLEILPAATRGGALGNLVTLDVREVIDVSSSEACICAIPEGAYLGRRLVGSSLATCFDEAFGIAGRQGVLAVATEVWDAHLDPSTYAVEMLAACD